MDKLFYTRHQLKVFVDDLPRLFLNAGFEIIEEPYIDHGLCGFRATYIRRYLFKQPMPFQERILTTIVHAVGLPFGNHGQKMVVLMAPRDLKNESVCETIKLRIHFDADGSPNVIQTDQQHDQQHDTGSQPTSSGYRQGMNSNHLVELDYIQHDIMSKHQGFFGVRARWSRLPDIKFYKDLAKILSSIIEAISPGLIQLPIEMKLEVLKKMDIESIIKMSQVNSEFRQLIFKKGESLWCHLCNRDYNIKFINRLIHRSWMDLYRDTYLMHQLEKCRKERALPGLPERLALPPVPFRQPIEWLHHNILELPFHPLHEEVFALPDNPVPLALEFPIIRRVDSLDSLR